MYKQNGPRESVFEALIIRRDGSRMLLVPVIRDADQKSENAKRPNHLARHDVVADIEVQQRALSLRPPIFIGRHFNFAHRIGFDAGVWFSGFLRH